MRAHGEKISQFREDYDGIKTLVKDGGDAESLIAALLLLELLTEDSAH